MPSASAHTASVSHNQDSGPPPGAMNANVSASNRNVIYPGQSGGSGGHSRRSSTTVEDYSRIMLEYTQRRMAGFADRPGDSGRRSATSRSSRSSNTSGQSGTSMSGFLAGQATGPGPGSGSGSALTGRTHSPADSKIRHVDFGAGVSDGE
ncbi:predicted protein [Aspergillus nidulans FGSC A4]|jgi:hypothetical protein|uniref:Uncharacterized protein n=1 Tax=Emericella nidulans (strain FGSC A4 / ATCC 38163 / CBS 112.46 / NRRL 194 / M139) TaxID=227321 RepID=Q5AU35_EMENI|nr:hypothetical protein [Aspergillus nidulans FGSC A4]EAA58839.1 predicted protein [Aspergillus nidulans FGSC A4]CBF74085.1 TPA: hypothetical protein ANIA_08195 [Aspergillus nidulans FGSC A4]|eukprot:XP_681464.1 predicted protein [Aspergillus nidulans FGSC A4]